MEQNSIIRMPDFPTVWVKCGPESLFNIVIEFCISHPYALCGHDITSLEYKSCDNIALRQAICNRIIELSTSEEHHSALPEVIRYFSDSAITPLTRANLNYSSVTDEEIKNLCRHPINELKLYKCPDLTSESLTYINEMSSLISLDIGETDILKPPVHELSSDEDDSDPTNVANPALLPPNHPNTEELGGGETLQTLAIKAPKLALLGLENGIKDTQSHALGMLLRNLPYLTHLDLSRCCGVGDLSCLANKPQLMSLVLFNVKDVPRCFPAIQTLKSLSHLDISFPVDCKVFFEKPNQTLKDLVESLENLESLDISGTNLAGDRIQERTFPQNDTTHDPKFLGTRLKEACAEHHPSELDVTDIPGLISRVGRPLKYLGLYNTAFDACYRHHIPAKRISGKANEDQILIAAQVNITRVEVIQKILNDLLHVFKSSTCTNIRLALDVVLHAMSIHLSEKNIQISGSSSLFHIVKSEEKEQFPYKVKKKIIETLLKAMYEHKNDVKMLRNGCLSLVRFRIPEDMFFEYERWVSLLLTIVSARNQDELVQRVGVVLLNSLAREGDSSQRLFVGDAGAIETMLKLIRSRLASQTCDEVMETAWSTMWNITDETPINCERFLKQDGMQLFVSCLETFPIKAELLLNMMGLLGNVAEVKELRPWLMKDEYIAVFYELLNSKCNGIEVSYGAAGILSHIASDGPELWMNHNINVVSRQKVLDRMVTTITSWDLDTGRSMNYRYFKPILRLLLVEHTPEAQLWAVWSLANLTNVYPEKYCPLLKEEGGLPMIMKLCTHSNLTIQQLVDTILLQCSK